MKITFHGAAGHVTGSKHLISLTNGKKILLDCGMSQGEGEDTEPLNNDWGFNPKDINHIVLSHAHIDHSGLIPKLVKDGFRGRVWATSGTADLSEILLLNSAEIQTSDVRFINKRRAKENKPPIEPLYNEEDARKAIQHFEVLDYNESRKIEEDIELQFFNVGHIVGAVTVFLTIKENGGYTRIAYSGDVGRYGDPILKSPQRFPQADFVIIESTYGDKLHQEVDTYANELKRHIEETCMGKGGKLIIPAFSVGRTQELLFGLNELEENGVLPPIKYYVDSPLSIEATEIVKRHTECFNKSVIRLMRFDPDPFEFKGLRYVKDVEESKSLNGKHDPCVIISASGMADAGRVKHHILNNIENKRNTIMLVGYCEPNSLGARLKQRPEEVTIFGERLKVSADIRTIDSMSAHADYDDLSQYLACQDPERVKRIFIVHGEPEVQEAFRKRLIKKGFDDVHIPKMHEEIGLG
ncbi:MAG: MBL fold metallo-hydrolase [Prevotellaceae bacterium]|jgi:metallo-beta-lactamase family protein|nr:MBL fold metallo-hydrolase [Prevotellaceae bacterium]